MIRLLRNADPEWLAARMNYLTASDVGAVLGENEYATRDQVRMEKAGLAEPFQGSERTDLSLLLEPWIAERARDKWGWNLIPHGKLIVDRECPRLAATPDYHMDTPWGWCNVQIKVTSVKPYEEVKKYGGKPPLMYQLQTQAEMACLGYANTSLLVMHLMPLCLRAYHIPRHSQVIARIRAEAVRFMAEVEALKVGKVAV